MWTEGYLYNYWFKVHVRANESVLTIHQSVNSSVVMDTVHLDKVTAVIESSNFPDKKFTFQVNTSEKVYNFMAESEQDKQNWMEIMNRLIRKYADNAGASVDDKVKKALFNYLPSRSSLFKAGLKPN